MINWMDSYNNFDYEDIVILLDNVNYNSLK